MPRPLLLQRPGRAADSTIPMRASNIPSALITITTFLPARLWAVVTACLACSLRTSCPRLPSGTLQWRFSRQHLHTHPMLQNQGRLLQRPAHSTHPTASKNNSRLSGSHQPGHKATTHHTSALINRRMPTTAAAVRRVAHNNRDRPCFPRSRPVVMVVSEDSEAISTHLVRPVYRRWTVPTEITNRHDELSCQVCR